MESSFFYYSVGTGENVPAVHNLSAEKYVNIGYSVEINIRTDDKDTRIIVPETKDGLPVGMFKLRTVRGNSPLGISPVKYIYIPSSVKYIDVSCSDGYFFNIFNGCTAEISPENPYFCVYGHGIYSKDMTELYYIFSPDETFTVPDGVKRIRSRAGAKIKGIKKLIIPESVEEIEDNAFYGAEVEEAEIHAKMIGSAAFFANGSLKKLTLSGFEHIDGNAFANCGELTTVTAKNSKCFDLNILHGVSDKLSLVYSDCGIITDSWNFPGVNVRRLSLSPNVKKIGKNIIRDGVLEIVSVNDKLNFSYKDLLRASEFGVMLSVRCAETDEILYGIDLWFRANKFHNGCNVDINYCQRITLYNGVYEALSDACGYFRRYQNQANFKKDVFKPLRQYVHDLAAAVAWGLTADGNYEKLSELQCFDVIDDKHFCDLIGYSAKRGTTEITALLMQKLHEKRMSLGQDDTL